MPSDLDLKQQRFVEEYLIDLDAAAAYMRAFNVKDRRRAASNSYRLLGLPNIKSAIIAAQRQRSQRIQVTGDRVVQEIAAIAFSRLTDVFEFNADGNGGNGEIRYRSTATMPDTVKAVLSEVVATKTVKMNGRSEHEATLQLKIKTHNKMQALSLLVKMLGLDLNGSIAAVTKAGYLVVDPHTQRQITADTDVDQIEVDYSQGH